MIRLSFSVTEEQKRELYDLAAKAEVSVSEYIKDQLFPPPKLTPHELFQALHYEKISGMIAMEALNRHRKKIGLEPMHSGNEEIEAHYRTQFPREYNAWRTRAGLTAEDV